MTYIVLAVAVACVSVASVLIRLSSAPAAVLAVYRLGLSFLALTPLVARSPRPVVRGARELGLSAVAGLALALHFLLWITSLSYTSVTSSVLLVTLHPIMVLPIARLTGERIGARQVGGTALALAGLVITTGGLSAPTARGDLLALAGAVMMGIYLLVGRQVRRSTAALPYVWTVYGMASAVLLIWAAVTRLPLYPYPGREYALFWALALIPTVGGHGLFNWALPHVGAARVSVSTLGEPVGAAILALMVLGEVPTVREMVGGTVILLGLLVTLNRERPAPGRSNGNKGGFRSDRDVELG